MNIKKVTGGLLLSAFLFSNVYGALPIGTMLTSRSVTIQGDGKIVTAGRANVCDLQQVFIARYNTNGTLDNTFNGVGYVLDPIGTISLARDVAIQPDNSIVITGFTDDMLLVERYSSTGAHDNSLSVDGRIIEPINIQTTGNAVVMQGTNILIGGETTAATTRFMLTRYDSGGSIDPTFGVGGITVTAIGNGSAVQGLGFQTDGSIIAAGSAILNGTPAIALARYSANGTLDGTFGTAGITTTILSGTESSEASNVVIDVSDRIIVAGRVYINGFSQLFVARYTSSGVLDNTFGTSSGYTALNVGGFATSVAIQSDGMIVAAGYTNSQIVIARFSANGILDPTFGSGGIQLVSAGNITGAWSLALQTNDQAVVAGFQDKLNSVARFATGGTLDGTFGSGGITNEPIPSESIACA